MSSGQNDLAATGDANTYRFRAECGADVDALSAILPADRLVSIRYWRVDERFPDCQAEVIMRGVSLDELRQWMRCVADGQVMVDTVQPPAIYTGRRSDA
jgi:hypothetical protein